MLAILLACDLGRVCMCLPKVRHDSRLASPQPLATPQTLVAEKQPPFLLVVAPLTLQVHLWDILNVVDFDPLNCLNDRQGKAKDNSHKKAAPPNTCLSQENQSSTAGQPPPTARVTLGCLHHDPGLLASQAFDRVKLQHLCAMHQRW